MLNALVYILIFAVGTKTNFNCHGLGLGLLFTSKLIASLLIKWNDFLRKSATSITFKTLSELI